VDLAITLSLCLRVCLYVSTITTEPNDMKTGTVVVPDSPTKPIDFEFKRLRVWVT